MEYLDKQELRRLFSVAYECNRNHHLFLVVALAHALRVSEAIEVRGTDIQDGKLAVARLKKGKDTLQPIRQNDDPLFDESAILAFEGSPERLFNFSRQRADVFIKKYCKLSGIHSAKAHMQSAAFFRNTAMGKPGETRGQTGRSRSFLVLGHEGEASLLGIGRALLGAPTFARGEHAQG